MIQAIILGILGLVFFFIGVFELNSVVQKIFNFRIRQYLQSVNKNRFFGAIFGFILTALLQSSSVASVLIIALVNAGLLNFLGSLPIILGIGVGSTIAPALVAFKITNIAPIFIIIGGFLYLFSKKDKLQSLGQAFLYFGLLFFGLDLIGEAAEPIKNSAFFMRLAQEGMSPFFGLLFGIIFTAIIQSSVVPIGLLVILAGEGLVGLNLALPIILGANIGTTFSAILVSLKENLAAKRTALFYLIFKIIGVIIIFPFLGLFTSFLEKIFPSLPFQIIGAHFFFNLFLFLIFIFLTEAIGKIIKQILPGEEKVLPLFPIYLDKRLTGYPSQSFSVVLKELSRAVILIKEMFEETENLFIDFKPSAFKRIDYIEVVIDELQDEILDFLDCLKKEKLTQKETEPVKNTNQEKQNEQKIKEPQKNNNLNQQNSQTQNQQSNSNSLEKEFWDLVHSGNAQMESYSNLLRKHKNKGGDIIAYLNKICKNSDTFKKFKNIPELERKSAKTLTEIDIN